MFLKISIDFFSDQTKIHCCGDEILNNLTILEDMSVTTSSHT